jgi:hypothetical protein
MAEGVLVTNTKHTPVQTEIVNSSLQPVPVTGEDISLVVDLTHIVAAPGDTPPSPAEAMCVQGITGMTPVVVEVANGASFSIPPFDYIGFTYVGSTNNIATQVFKSGGSGGTTVATLTYAYVGGTPSTDDALIASITQS